MEKGHHPLHGVLANIVGDKNVSDDTFNLLAYARDGSPLASPKPPGIIVRPGSTEEISQIVKLANMHRIPVTPRGGGSSYTGDFQAIGGGILLDLTRLNKIKVHDDRLHITVGAGWTFTKLEYELARKGLELAIQGPHGGISATIGGTVSVHGFQLKSMKASNINEQVTGLEVVLPTGEIIKTGSGAHPANEPIRRWVNGPDLAGLFMGSRGVFGTVTEVTLRIYPRHEAEAYLTYGFRDIEALTRALLRITATHYAVDMIYWDKDDLPILATLPMVEGKEYEDIEEDMEGAFFVVLEGRKDEIKLQSKVIDEIVAEEGGKVVKPPMDAEVYWKSARYASPPPMPGTSGPPGETPTAHPMNQLPELIREFRQRKEEWFDRMVEHNIVVMFFIVFSQDALVWSPVVQWDQTNPEATEQARKLLEEWDEAGVGKWGGAPHTIGQDRARRLFRGLGSVHQVMVTLKKALDPNNIMNPGVLDLPGY